VNETPTMESKDLKIGDRVRVRMSKELEGLVHRIGTRSATVEVETELGPLVISSPLAAIERLNGGDAPQA
jgi:hypothetical protein